MSDLIDTTQMYLRTVYELIEEGIVPMRARIVERLEQSGPTVSQTVARMERDGLVRLGTERQVVFTELGLAEATSVMRRHRLAECFLIQILHLNMCLVHEEACRWEHVISDQVEAAMDETLGHPTHSPFGMPIPSPGAGTEEPSTWVKSLQTVGHVLETQEVVSSQLVAIGEGIQAEEPLIDRLCKAGFQPGISVTATKKADYIELLSAGKKVALHDHAARSLYLSQNGSA